MLNNVLAFPVRKTQTRRPRKGKVLNNVIEIPAHLPEFKTIVMACDFGDIKEGETVVYQLDTWAINKLVIMLDIEDKLMIGKLTQTNGQYYMSDSEGNSFKAYQADIEAIVGQIVGRICQKNIGGREDAKKSVS